LGEAKDDTPIEEFLVKKLRTDNSLQNGGHYRFSGHLGQAKDDTSIQEFLVKKLPTDNCLQKGGHCVKVELTAGLLDGTW